MGCFESSRSKALDVQIPMEERYFAREKTLKYGNAQVETVFRSAVRFADLNNMLTLPKLKMMLEQTGLEVSRLGTFDSPISKFYSSFCQNRTYDCRQIKLLAILLSPGAVDTKSHLLFDEFDKDGSGSLEMNEVTSMVTLAVNIALVHLPILSVEIAKTEKKEHEIQAMQTYAQKLASNKKKAANFIRGQICSSASVTYKEFLDCMKNTNAQALFHAPMLRALCLNLDILDQEVVRDEVQQKVERTKTIKKTPTAN